MLHLSIGSDEVMILDNKATLSCSLDPGPHSINMLKDSGNADTNPGLL